MQPKREHDEHEHHTNQQQLQYRTMDDEYLSRPNLPLPQQSQPSQHVQSVYTESSLAESTSASSSSSSWNWINTAPAHLDASSYFDYDYSPQSYYDQQPPPPAQPPQPPHVRPLSPLPVLSYPPPPQPPPSSHAVYQQQQQLPPPAIPPQPSPSLGMQQYYINRRTSTTSSEFSELKSSINYEVLPPISSNFHQQHPSQPSPVSPESYACQPSQSSNVHPQPTPLPPPPPIVKRKGSANTVRPKSSTASLRSRSKNSPSYLLDKRPPDATGFVNYDARDGHVIMSAVAPSGNCKKYKNRISKKPSNARLRGKRQND